MPFDDDGALCTVV